LSERWRTIRAAARCPFAACEAVSVGHAESRVMDRNRRDFLVGGSFFGALALAALLPAMCAERQMRRTFAMPENGHPQRPSGQAKPLLEEDIAPMLARLDAWYAAHLAPETYRFNPPATAAQLDAFEHLIGLEVPRAYRQLYLWHDGEEDDRWGHIYGLPLLPLDQAAAQWKAWTDTLAEFGGDRYAIPGGAWPEGAVDPAYINPRWIPLTHDGSGNHIGLDFDPWPGGRVGQVILFGRDEDVKAVLAESLGKFLEWIAGLLESGNFRLGPPDGEPVLREFRLKRPPADHFHDGARTLLGAPGPFV
jgi:cell wall assembly regulator SMI1